MSASYIRRILLAFTRVDETSKSVPGPATDLFYPDADQSEQQKLIRERHFHVFEIPSLRLLGFSIMTVLVCLRRTFVPGEPSASPYLLGAVVLTYSLVSWAILYLFFSKVKRVHLGTLFLSIDVFAFIFAIYLTGADKSWLFFLLFIRTADQANTNFKRALGFAQLSVAAYGLLLFELAFVEHRAIAWPAEIFKLLILFGANSYVALTARTAERMRERMVSAIRLARDLVAPAGSVTRARGGAPVAEGEPIRSPRQRGPRIGRR